MSVLDTLTEKYLPCANPELVVGYVSIEQITSEPSVDFDWFCHECEGYWCEHQLESKRIDESYQMLVQHFRNGGMVNQPVQYFGEEGGLGNGHHRVIAAMDAGFTHVPVQDGWGDDF